MDNTIKVLADNFVFKSSKESSYILNTRHFLCSCDGLKFAGKLYSKYIDELKIDYICGLLGGSSSLVYSVANENNKDFFLIRKDYNTKYIDNKLIGNFKTNSNVLIVDDTVTTGRSIIYLLNNLVEYDINIKGIIILVSRNNLAMKNIMNYCNIYIKKPVLIKDIVTKDELFKYKEMMEI